MPTSPRKKGVILSGAQSAESKNLRIIVLAMEVFGAKILRLPLVAQDDSESLLLEEKVASQSKVG